MGKPRDEVRTAALVENLGAGMRKGAAGLAAGYAPSDANHAAERAIKDAVISQQVIARLHKTAVTWRKLVRSAKAGLARNLDPRNWEPRLVKMVTKDGRTVEKIVPAAVKASDINTAAKVVLDSLRTIDASTLSEKAATEDKGESDVSRATRILGDHGVN